MAKDDEYKAIGDAIIEILESLIPQVPLKPKPLPQFQQEHLESAFSYVE